MSELYAEWECCGYAAFRLLFAGPYTSAMQKAAEEYQLGRTS